MGAIESRSPTKGASLSGNERDHLFLNLEGRRFVDISGPSGLDHLGDGRSFGILDYDRDGWVDVAVASANAPLLQLYRNQIGELQPEAPANFVALRFVGGNLTSNPSKDLSNRDGYGAMVTLELGERTLRREHRAGEGLAAQNSSTMIVGIGRSGEVNSLTVRWPSGRTQTVPRFPAGSLVTAYEEPSQSPATESFTIEPYRVSVERRSMPSPAELPAGTAPVWPVDGNTRETSHAKLVLYTTFATWCHACKVELPQLQYLRSAFAPSELAMFGVPYDEKEAPDKLNAWASVYQPPYELLTDLPAAQVVLVQQYVRQSLQLDGIPASIVTGSDGRVLLKKWGAPTVSELRELLALGVDE